MSVFDSHVEHTSSVACFHTNITSAPVSTYITFKRNTFSHKHSLCSSQCLLNAVLTLYVTQFDIELKNLAQIESIGISSQLTYCTTLIPLDIRTTTDTNNCLFTTTHCHTIPQSAHLFSNNSVIALPSRPAISSCPLNNL